MSNNNDSTNPFTDPAIVRVQAQQTAASNEPNHQFGYNTTTEQTPTLNTHNTPVEGHKYAATPTALPANPSQNILLTNGRNKNFPYIPPGWTWCPKPCFYFNISEEIPPELQSLVRRHYYFSLGYAIVMLVNIAAAIGYLILSYPSKVAHFLVAILVGPLLLVLIFVLQYYVLYKACRLSSASYYMWYMVNSVGCAIVVIVQAIGPSGSGWCGLIVAAHAFDSTTNRSIFMGILSLLISLGYLSFLANMIYTVYNARTLYMVAKHRELSNAIQGHQGPTITYSIPVAVV